MVFSVGAVSTEMKTKVLSFLLFTKTISIKKKKIRSQSDYFLLDWL